MNAQDEESFRAFVAGRSPALLRVALLLCGGDRHAAEDLLQSALLKALARWRRVREPEAYVRKVLYRQQVNRWRLRRRQRELAVAELPEPDSGPELGPAFGPAFGPGDSSLQDPGDAAELRIVLRRALSVLTPRQRTVLVLRFEDLPEAEVARLLGCSVGTVRSTSHRSLAKLRELAPELAALRRGEAPAGPCTSAEVSR